jgi:hypothetical protein
VLVTTPAVVEGLPAGTHTIRLEPAYDKCKSVDETASTDCTGTNYQDEFGVTIVDL